MNALITGGAGFIGSHLARALLDRGDQVRILDDFSTGHRANVPDGATLIEGSILDPAAVREAVADSTVIFHEAAMVSVPLSVEQPDACVELNLVGTQRIIEAACDANVRRIVLASSAAVYGDDAPMPTTEDSPPDPRSPYAATKMASEHLLRSAAACYDISTVSLRYFNIFGPRQDPNSAYAAAIAAFADALTSGRAPMIFGDGEQTRDFTPVANVVHANLLAADTSNTLHGEAMNIGTGKRTSLLDVIARMQDVLGTNAEIVFKPERAGDVRHSCADIQRAKKLIGYEPISSFDTGIEALLSADRADV
ncbi:MAG: NAD-dependent epimerase/dehydratase family protein [Planctomycetota bacterium]